MKKIISLFKRDYEGTRLVCDEIVPGAEWVVAGEGVATIKWDGTACMVRDGVLYKRYDRRMKTGKYKSAPEGWEAAQDADFKTRYWPGWVPVGDGPEDKWHREAFERDSDWENGTYELLGPKVQGNPYLLAHHTLFMHGCVSDKIGQFPRTFDGLRQWLAEHDSEGIVWHHPDGRMVKIKRKDFGLAWPLE